ncbi:Acg family FMN-binding oxidoreductase [Aquibium microcysteis]|uniref:Acg family FMN-binding oxidoreductase n=1 Tax=Aquibium microcysteis TaxID=675281 RepID=UPI00165D172D|nr:nitroreductase family protein [Aquibium microcysteis]
MLTRRAVLCAGGAGIVGSLAGCGKATDMTSYENTVRRIRVRMPGHGGLVDCARYATLAANGHNTQPWRFALTARRVEILPDLTRRTPVVDPDDHHLWVSLGCAAENFLIAARAVSLHGDVVYDAAGDGRLVLALERGPAGTDDLFEAVPRRQSTRSDYDGRPVAAADLKAMEDAARIDGIRIVYLLGESRLAGALDHVVAGNTVQMEDPAFLAELRHWLRFNPRQAIDTGDGLYAAASGNPTLPNWMANILFPLVFRTRSENDRYASQVRSSAGIAVFVSARDDREHWVRAGRACQRFALKATSLGIAHAFVNQPVEVAGLRADFARWLGLDPAERPDLVVRFGYAPPLPMSLRRPVDAVVI